jgi:hypothetical protein
LVLIANTNTAPFGGPTATSFISGHDIEVARFDLSAGEGVGDFNATTGSRNLVGNWKAGNPLAIYWFPTLTYSSPVPGAGTTYGFYTDPTGIDGSAPWVTPADGSTVGLLFLTSDVDGSNPTDAGLASFHITPPLAVSDSIVRYPSQGVKVAVTALLSNDSGSSLTLSQVSATSTNGGTVMRTGDWIFYTPLTGFTNIDLFTYTVIDSFGGTATGTVTINIKVDTGQSVNITGIATTEGTNKLISFIGIPLRSYTIQAATNVVSTNWQVIGTSTAAGGGLFNFKDTNAYLYPMRFYRSVYP